MKKVLVLGASGMLGHQVCSQLVKHGFAVIGSFRKSSRAPIPNGVEKILFDVVEDSPVKLSEYLSEGMFILNCIGKLKADINLTEISSIEQAIKINSLFPIELNRVASKSDTKIIQIATDCVFSGREGKYKESDAHDALDVYGKTKSLGQVISGNVMNIGCSIIGREQVRNSSLLEWVLNQPQGAQINGYKNHIWNGVTTLAFARVVVGILRDELFKAGTQHLVPANELPKGDLVEQIANYFNREDIKVAMIENDVSINRSLSTIDPNFNLTLWQSAGYEQLPTINQLLAELVE